MKPKYPCWTPWLDFRQSGLYYMNMAGTQCYAAALPDIVMGKQYNLLENSVTIRENLGAGFPGLTNLLIAKL